MPWRKWIVRGVVYGILVLCATAALLYQRWTNSASVREQVMRKLDVLFPGAQVSVDSARLRILGGIKLTGLRVCRRDDPDKHEFLHVPEAIFYHDKEKILEGELVLRKVELFNPRLRVERDRTGKWNVKGLSGAIKPQLFIPTVVVHHGTVIFDDRLDGANLPALEMNDVNLTLINDPLPTVTVRAAAQSPVLGKWQLQASVQRPTRDVTLSFQAKEVPVNRALVQRFTANAPADLMNGLELEAKTEVAGEVAYHPGQSQPLYYDVRAQLTKGKLSHPQLPLPLDELFALVHFNNGAVRLEKFDARSGPTEVHASGLAQLPSPEKDFAGHLEVKHLALGKELAERVPAKLRKLYDAFLPQGPATLHVDCVRQAGAWTKLADGTPSRVSLRPENVSICFNKFAYPLERVTGTIDYNLSNQLVEVDVTAHAGTRPVFIKGDWRGEGTAADARFDIHATDVPIDETLISALPEARQKLARSFHARGRADVKAHVRHESGALDFRNEYHIRFHDTSILWDSFPYPLEKVSGVLDIFPDHWECHEFKASHQGGQVVVNGRSTPNRLPSGEKVLGLSVEIAGTQVRLDEELRQALKPMPHLLKAWEIFHPEGRLNFTAVVNHPTGQVYDLDVKVDANGCAVRPTFFNYHLHDLEGQFHYHQHRLELTKLRALHQDTVLMLDRGAVDLHPGGGFYADLAEVQAQALRFDEDFIAALPKKLQEAARGVRLKDAASLKSRLIVAQAAEPGSPVDIFWDDFELGLRGANLTFGVDLTNVTGTLACRGRYDGRQLVGINGNLLLDHAAAFKQPFRNVQANFQVRSSTPDVLLVGLRAPLFGGDVAGQIRVDFNSTTRYEANLTASQIDLQQFGRHNLGPTSEISGMAMARLHLTGQGGNNDTLDGNGSIDVPSGRLYNLPLLLDLLKFLGLHWPDRTAFEEAHALFSIRGQRVNVRRLDLLGNAISVSGKGEINLDGTDIKGDFYTTTRIEQLLPPAIRPFPPAISKNLLTIEVRGNATANPAKDLQFQKRWVPILFDPLVELQQRLGVNEAKMEKRN